MTSILLLIGFAILCGTFTLYINRGSTQQSSTWEQFTHREQQANFITKKDFPSWLLLTFEKDNIPSVENSLCQNHFTKLMRFVGKPMVDLSGYNNIELKEQFGINHFAKLVQYEETFFVFIEALYQYALSLEEQHYLTESKLLLEYMLEKKWLEKKCSSTHKRVCDTINKINKSENFN